MTNGDIIVQTPAYLGQHKDGINVIDEYQFLSFHNKDYLMVRKNWKNMLLMSATPMVPLLAAAQDAGIQIEYIKPQNLRTCRRYFAQDKRAFNIERMPPHCITFSTQKRKVNDGNIMIKQLHEHNATTAQNAKRIIAHPNFVFGYSPHIPLIMGIFDFVRRLCVCSNDPGIMKMIF